MKEDQQSGRTIEVRQVIGGRLTIVVGSGKDQTKIERARLGGEISLENIGTSRVYDAHGNLRRMYLRLGQYFEQHRVEYANWKKYNLALLIESLIKNKRDILIELNFPGDRVNIRSQEDGGLSKMFAEELCGSLGKTFGISIPIGFRKRIEFVLRFDLGEDRLMVVVDETAHIPIKTKIDVGFLTGVIDETVVAERLATW